MEVSVGQQRNDQTKVHVAMMWIVEKDRDICGSDVRE